MRTENRKQVLIENESIRACPNCSKKNRKRPTYHGTAMLAARIKRNTLAEVVDRMPQYSSTEDVPEHLF